MNKITSVAALRELKAKTIDSRNPNATVVAVGMATCGVAAGARDVFDALNSEITARKIKNVEVISTGCLGFCYAEPLVEVRAPGQKVVRYRNVDAAIAKEIVDSHLADGRPVQKAVFTRGASK